MQEKDALARAMNMVRDLRERCSWDRVQTRETLRPYLLEEAHELDRAIRDDDRDAIRAEVADLLLHLAWQLVLAEESRDFSPSDVATDLETKMKRRHPHLFGLGPKEPWERLKQKERPRGVLEGIPDSLPSLLFALRLGQRAATVGFDWHDPAGPLDKLREEVAEAEAAVASADHQAISDEIGDLLFSVVNLARKVNVYPDRALEDANRRFRNRFELVEKLARDRDLPLEQQSLEKLEALWVEAKQLLEKAATSESSA